MYQLQVGVGQAFPISLVLLCDGKQGKVVFIKTHQFNPIFDEDESGTLLAVFDMEGFVIGDEDFSYNTPYDYKNIEVMLKWLKTQNLQWPSDNGWPFP